MAQPRILLITTSLPYPITTGDRQRTEMLFRALSAVGPTDLYLVTQYEAADAATMDELRNRFNLVGQARPLPFGRRGIWRPLHAVKPGFADKIAEFAGQFTGLQYRTDPRLHMELQRLLAATKYDVIVSRLIRPGARAGALSQSAIPVVIDIDDLDTQVYRARLARGGSKAMLTIKRAALRRLEATLRSVLARAARLWIAAPGDQSEIQHPHLSVLPNVPYTPAGQAAIEPLAPSDGKRILIVGNFEAPMNVLGVSRFLDHVWPAVRDAEPAARFRIVGKIPQDLRDRWAALPGVEPVGFVDDLRAEYAACAFTVAPVYEGGGTKIKVLESLNYGRAVALPPHALRGYEHILAHGKSVWLAENDSALAQACIMLLHDPAQRQSLADEGARQVRTHFSYTAFANEVARTIGSVAPLP